MAEETILISKAKYQKMLRMTQDQTTTTTKQVKSTQNYVPSTTLKAVEGVQDANNGFSLDVNNFLKQLYHRNLSEKRKGYKTI